MRVGLALLTHTNVDSADCRVHCILCEATLQVKCKQQQQQQQRQQYALHGQGRRVWLLGLANARHALAKYCGGVNSKGKGGRRSSANRVLFAIIACCCVCAGPDNPSQPKCHNTTQFSHQHQQHQHQQGDEEVVSAAGAGAGIGAGAGPVTGPLNKSQLIEF